MERERVVVVPGDASGKAELDNSGTDAGGRGGNERAYGVARNDGQMYGGVVEAPGQVFVEAPDAGVRNPVELPGWRG